MVRLRTPEFRGKVTLINRGKLFKRTGSVLGISLVQVGSNVSVVASVMKIL